MSYSTGETAILTRLRAHSDFDSNNTDANNWQILSNGKNKYYAILKPSDQDHAVEFITPTIYTVTWGTVIEVWQIYENATDTPDELWATVNKVLGQIQAYKTLGDATTYLNAEIISFGPVTEVMEAGSEAPRWLKQEVNVEWVEKSDSLTYV